MPGGTSVLAFVDFALLSLSPDEEKNNLCRVFGWVAPAAQLLINSYLDKLPVDLKSNWK